MLFKRHNANADFLEFLNHHYGTKDSDQDGIADEVEGILGTDPYKFDTDGDGMGDGEEIIKGRNPLGNGKLHDFFVPHAGNDYKPLALHPQRLFFYGLSAVLVKMIIVFFIISFPTIAWLSPDVLQESGQKIIELTNQLRQKVGVAPLVESQALDQAAYAKAQDMLLQQYFAHVGPDKKSLVDWLFAFDYDYMVAGENLALGFAAPEDVVEAWSLSKTHYANLIDPDFSQIGIGVISGPYNGQDTTLIAQYFGYPRRGTAKQVVLGRQTKAVEQQPATALFTPDEDESGENAAASAAILFLDATQIEQALAAGEDEVVATTDQPTKQTIDVVRKSDQPRLISPIDGFVTNQEEIELNIWSPGTEAVAVYIDGQLFKEEPKDANSSLQKINIKLEEGQHTLIIEAFVGDRKDISPFYKITVDQRSPVFDQAGTLLEIRQADNGQEAMINFSTRLSPDTVSAELNFAGYNLPLYNIDSSQWGRQAIVYEQDLFNTIVLANLTLQDQAGNVAVYDLDLNNIVPSQVSWLDKYAFLKAYPTKYMHSVLDVGSSFIKLLLLLAILALGLNVFLEIKKQHPKIILTSLLFIVLLLTLMLL